MMRVRPRYFPFASLALAALLTTGCASSTGSNPKPSEPNAKSQIPDPAPDRAGHPTAPINPVDACSDRLQDLAGSLLFYYAVNKRLPGTLTDLKDVDGNVIPPEQLTCPVSHKPYVYDPRGIPAGPDKPGVIVLADPEPTHSGLRWAITVEKPRNPTQPLITHLVAVPETTFHGGLPEPKLPDRGGRSK